MKLTQAEMDTIRRATLSTLETAFTTDHDGMGGFALGRVAVLVIHREEGADMMLNAIRTMVHTVFGPPSGTTSVAEEIREDPRPEEHRRN